MTGTDSPSSGARFERLLIVRLSSMGDIIHALPSAVMLREAFPHATIGWLVEERWAELLCTLSTPRHGARSPQRPLADAVHIVNLKKWRKSLSSNQTWERVAAGVSELRAMRYQVAVDLQGAARSAILARWSGASTIYGAAQPRENLASLWYTRQVITEHRHVIEQYAEITEAVTRQPRPIPDAIFPCDPVAEESVAKRLSEANLRNFAILNPGAGWGASLINFGPREEGLAKIAEAASEGTARAMSFSIGELIALTRRARLFIGGDTGPMHLATALHIPVVALFGPTDPARNGPYRTKSIVLRHPASPTTLTHRAQSDPGLLAINVEEVVAAATRLMEECRG
jgi:heptosyltransferase-1